MLSVLKRIIKNEVINKESKKILDIETLQAGDMILFEKMSLDQVSNKILKVENKIIYNIEGKAIIEYVLDIEGEEFLLSKTDDGITSLKLRKSLTSDEVAESFGLKEFAQIFSHDYKSRLVSISVSNSIDGLISSSYHKQIDCADGIMYIGDNATEKHKLDYYYLTDNAKRYFIEAEIYQDMEAKVFAGLYLPISAIKEVISYL